MTLSNPPPRKRARVLQRQIDRALKIGLVLTAVAVAALVAAAFWGGTGGVVVATVASAVLTIAIGTFLYEPFREEGLAQEILERLGVRDSLARAQVREITTPGEFDLLSALGLSRAISRMPQDPLTWAQSEFRALLAHASTHPVNLSVYVPAPDQPFLAVLANVLRQGEDELKTRLAQLPDALIAAWDEQPRHALARLELFQFQGVPAVGLLQTDAFTAIELGPALRFAPLDRTTQILVFEPAAPVAGWVKHQLTFPGDAIPPTPAGIRPAEAAPRREGRPHPSASAPATSPPPSVGGEKFAEGAKAGDGNDV